MSVTTTVTGVVPTGNMLPDAGVATTLATPQLSVLVGIAKLTIAPHWPGSLVTVMSAGRMAEGGSTSATVTVNVVFVLLPQASATVLVTVVVPTGKALPDTGTELTVSYRS